MIRAYLARILEPQAEMVITVQEPIFGVLLVEVAGDGPLDVEPGAELVIREDGGLQVLVDLGFDSGFVVDDFLDPEAEVELALLAEHLGDEEADLRGVLEVRGDLKQAVARGVEELVSAEVASDRTG